MYSTVASFCFGEEWSFRWNQESWIQTHAHLDDFALDIAVREYFFSSKIQIDVQLLVSQHQALGSLKGVRPWGLRSDGGGGKGGFIWEMRQEGWNMRLRRVDAGAPHWRTGWGVNDELGHGYTEDEGLLGTKWHNPYLRDMYIWWSPRPWEGMTLSENEGSRWPQDRTPRSTSVSDTLFAFLSRIYSKAYQSALLMQLLIKSCQLRESAPYSSHSASKPLRFSSSILPSFNIHWHLESTMPNSFFPM